MYELRHRKLPAGARSLTLRLAHQQPFQLKNP